MTNAEVVVEFGQRLWGAHTWVRGMAGFVEINPRTLSRIQAAVRCGQEYPAARGVVRALRQRLVGVLGDLEPWALAADDPT